MIIIDFMTRACEVCSVQFEVKPWPATRHMYCSRKCLHAAYRARNANQIKERMKTWACLNRDHRRAILKKYEQSEKGKRKSKQWRDSTREKRNEKNLRKYHNDPEFKKAANSRVAANLKLKKSGRTYICVECGANKRLHCHHGNLNPLDNALSNLVWLCRKCHMALHTEIRRSKELFIVRRTG